MFMRVNSKCAHQERPPLGHAPAAGHQPTLGSVRREVIEKQRRAPLIFGSAHIFRVPMDESVVHLIRNVINVFTIATPISMPTAKDLRTVQS
jgi:hypothetical protein